MGLGMDAFAVRRVREPDSSGFARTRASIIAHVDPQPTGSGFLVAGRKHRDRRVVRVELRSRHRVATQRFSQQPAEFFALSYPARHGGPIETYAVARRDLGLPIQRRMVRIFRNDDLGQQARMRDAALDWQPRHRTLRYMAATGADPFAADRADDLEHCCDARELLGHVLAEQLHGVVALRARRVRLEHAFFAWQMSRHGFLRGCRRHARTRCTSACTANIGNAAARCQILKLGFEPIDLSVYLLGFTTEVHAPELVDLRLQALKLLVPLNNLPVAFGDLLAHLCHRCLLLEHQGVELGNGLRKRRMVRHAPQFTSLRCGLQHRQCGRTTGLSPIDAFQQHRQLRRRQIDLASISLWPNKPSARKPLRKKP
ncbi:hypothetical protein AWB74_08783 [Caballeronia arvi]|uniref:Uncharacterized protein n=1 Tax=Caballeronia arvi TaxID=1777135 RepID=A0A158L703_9BURK|nr:hypothetical protein AWB74_08783 [Caballeronia arvi]